MFGLFPPSVRSSRRWHRTRQPRTAPSSTSTASTCHSDRAKTGGLTPPANHARQRACLDRDVGKSRAQAARRDDASARRAAARSAGDRRIRLVSRDLDRPRRADPAQPRPLAAASPQSHRIRQRDSRSARARHRRRRALLPADDEANGFDNIADVLKVSPSLLEQYLTASRKVASLAVGDAKVAPASTVYRVPPDRAQGDHVEGLPLGTRGGIVITHNFPLDADYDFRVNLLQNIVGYVPGLEWPHTLEISIDGERVFTAPVGGEADNKLSDTNLAQAKETLDQRLKARISREGRSARRRRRLRQEELGRVGRAAAAVHARSRHAEHERGSAHRARPDRRTVQRDAARATRRAGAGFSSASRQTASRAKKPRARRRSCRRWRVARIAVRSTPKSIRCSASTRPAARKAASTPASRTRCGSC